MTKPTESADVLFYPVEVAADNNTIAIKEDTTGDGSLDTVTSTTLAAGTYWPYVSGATPPAATTSLYDEAAAKLSAASQAGNTYAVEAQTPSGAQLENSGVRFRATSGTAKFQVEWNTASSVDPRWFGWPTSSARTNASTAAAPTDAVDSPYTPVGQWRPTTVFADDSATKKPFDRRRNLGAAGPDLGQGAQIERGTPTDMRSLVYHEVPAACVLGGRGDDVDYANLAGLATGDTHNGLLAWHDAVSSGDGALTILLHNVADRADHVVDLDADDVETGYLTPKAARSEFGRVREMTRPEGEFYKVDFQLSLETSSVSFE
jgi:hypothetical protein